MLTLAAPLALSQILSILLRVDETNSNQAKQTKRTFASTHTKVMELAAWDLSNEFLLHYKGKSKLSMACAKDHDTAERRPASYFTLPTIYEC